MNKVSVIFLAWMLAINFTTSAQTANIRVSNVNAVDPEETAVAIDYFNPARIASASNVAYFYSSSDSGKTWTQTEVTSTHGVWGDPSIVYDKKGNLYYAHLSNPQSGRWLDRIVVQKSTDNGITWNDGAGIGLRDVPKIEDKEWITADITESRFQNNLYLAWTERDKFTSSDPADSSRILFSRSTDGGETWSEPLRICDKSGTCNDDDNTVEGAVPAVGPEGQLYVAWSGPLGIMFDRSYDGGITWGKDIPVNEMPGGWDFEIPGLIYGNGMPVVASDIGNSPNRGNIYIMWGDTRNGADDHDIFISRSTDEGSSWSSPVKVNSDNSGRPQFFGWMTVDKTTGYLYVSFYDRRNTSGNDTDYYLARSTDGGNTFSNYKINTLTFTPTTAKFFGDYTNIAAHGGKIYPVWTQMMREKLSVWTAVIEDKSIITGIKTNAVEMPQFELKQNYPNPFNPVTNISYSVPGSSQIRLTVIDVLGREVKTLVRGYREAGTYHYSFDASDLPSGVYFYLLQSGEFSMSKKMILLK